MDVLVLIKNDWFTGFFGESLEAGINNQFIELKHNGLLQCFAPTLVDTTVVLIIVQDLLIYFLLFFS